jgi:hypothetical protein
LVIQCSGERSSLLLWLGGFIGAAPLGIDGNAGGRVGSLGTRWLADHPHRRDFAQTPRKDCRTVSMDRR